MSRCALRSIIAGIVWIGFHAACGHAHLAAEELAAVIDRVGDDIRYLASDELEGRGPATAGLQKAADFIRDRFREVGLSSGPDDGSFFCPFDITIDTKVDEPKTSLVLHGPGGIQLTLKLGEDYQPLATGGAANVRSELVFAGYGINAPDVEYSDYADADVAGKVVLVIRREPQQDDPNSAFDGAEVTEHSYIRTKFQAAKEAKVAAIIMVNDPFTTRKNGEDPLTVPSGFGTASKELPFAHVTQAVADQLLSVSPLKVGDEQLTSVGAVSDQIDGKMQPLTQAMEGWTAELKFEFEDVEAHVANVIGVIEGEGPLANETVVVGAHYDHLGYGPFGSRRPNERAIHNGADDNATGTAAIMELARRFERASTKPTRRIVFIAFTAEERGIIGARRYLESPLFPVEDTVAMVNFDMIGNLGEKGLQLAGVRTGKQFREIVDRVVTQDDLKVEVTNTLGGSDHSAFYREGVPVLFCFTGLTDLYHTPEDDFDTINVPGVVETIDFAERVVKEIMSLSERPDYVAPPRRRGRRGPMSYLGIVPDYNAEEGKGLAITDVADDSPAAQAGLEKGDVIIKLGEVAVDGFETLSEGLRKYGPGETVECVVRREDAEKTLHITLGRPGRRP